MHVFAIINTILLRSTRATAVYKSPQSLCSTHRIRMCHHSSLRAAQQAEDMHRPSGQLSGCKIDYGGHTARLTRSRFSYFPGQQQVLEALVHQQPIWVFDHRVTSSGTGLSHRYGTEEWSRNYPPSNVQSTPQHFPCNYLIYIKNVNTIWPGPAREIPSRRSRSRNVNVLIGQLAHQKRRTFAPCYT